jgi:hypothetical protein
LNLANHDENQLMQIIQQQPVVDRPRLKELRDRCEYGQVTPEEHQERMQYENELELHNARRVEAIFHLSQLKNTDFKTLYQQLTPKRYFPDQDDTNEMGAIDESSF